MDGETCSVHHLRAFRRRRHVVYRLAIWARRITCFCAETEKQCPEQQDVSARKSIAKLEAHANSVALVHIAEALLRLTIFPGILGQSGIPRMVTSLYKPSLTAGDRTEQNPFNYAIAHVYDPTNFKAQLVKVSFDNGAEHTPFLVIKTESCAERIDRCK